MSRPASDPLDPQAILGALGVTDVTEAVPVIGGADTAIWRVDRPGGRYALRVFRSEQVDTCQRELIAMRAAAAAGLPVPAVHAEGRWSDRPALLLSWCPGRALRDELVARPYRAWSLGLRFGEMQARVHQAPAPPELRGTPHDWIDWAGPGEEALRARLLSAAGDARALLHLDYHPLNVMTDGRQITAVLDWANARSGDARADVARTLTILRLSPARPGVWWLGTIVVRPLLEWGWRRGYRLAGGSTADMPLFYAWAGAVMQRDLAHRVGKPGTGLLPHHMERVRRWTAAWKRRAGIG